MQHDRNYLEGNPPQSPDGFTFDLQRFDTDTWDGNVGTVPDAVNGVITITTAEQLAALAKNVNGGNDYSGVTITLGANIDLSGHNWTPIGKNDSNPFKGTFDGNNANYTISNLTVNSGNYVGLFGYVYSGTVQNVTLENVNITGSSLIGGIVGYNEGTVSGCTVSGNVTGTGNGDVQVGGIVGRNYNGTVSGNTAIVTISGGKYAGGLVGYTNDKVKDNKFYSNTKYAVERDNSNNGVTNNTRYYSLTVLEGVTFTVTGGDTITDGTNTYYAGGTVTLTLTSTEAQLKDGYAFSTGNPFTITENTTVTCIPDPANHYVLDDDTKTLATADNTTNYPDLKQVYELTLPSGVTASGDTVITIDGKTYAAGSVTFTGVKTGYVIDGVNVTQDTTVTATFDTANHYVLADNTSTLATAENVGSYPDLVQVYELTLPSGVTASGDTVATANGKTYAAGSVTFTAAAGYTVTSITVNGETLDGKTFTVNASTEISAESSKSINGGKGVEVGGTTGDLSGNDAVYSITASQQNSTLVGNGKNNTVILTGGGENILTGGSGNDTFKFGAGGGIVTDFGIGATKSGDGNTLPTASGSDIVKVSGKVSGVYFDRDASSKKTPTFTAVVTYGSGDDNDTQIIVLQNINKKPTKTGSKPTYQTNDVAAATLKIWDTSSGKQAVISAAKLKKLFHDDSELSADLLQQVASLGKLDGIGDLNLPAVDALNQTAQATFNGDDNG